MILNNLIKTYLKNREIVTTTVKRRITKKREIGIIKLPSKYIGIKVKIIRR